MDCLRTGTEETPLTLPHDHTAHKHLDRPDAFKRYFSLASCLVQTELMSQFVLGHGVRMVDFVAEDQKRGLCEIFHGQKSVEFGFGFGETFVVLCID